MVNRYRVLFYPSTLPRDPPAPTFPQYAASSAQLYHLADVFLNNALTSFRSDPLLSNGLGVVSCLRDHVKEPVQPFTKTLAIAEQIENRPEAWRVRREILANTYTEIDFFDKAVE